MQAQAIDESCPWILMNYYSKAELKKTDPSDVKALQDLLKRTYDKPEKPLSAVDETWVEEFKLHEIVKQVREAGHKVDMSRKKQKAVSGLGVSIGGISLATVIGKHIYEKAIEVIDLEEVLNKKYGFALEGNDANELRFLQETIKCNPKTLSDEENKAFSLISEDLNDPKRVKKIILALVYGSHFVMSAKNNISLDQEYEKLYQLWKKTGLTLCTRWWHSSQEYFVPRTVDDLIKVTEIFPPRFFRALRGMKGIVMVKPGLQPRFHHKKPGTILGLYASATKQINLFPMTNSYYAKSDEAFLNNEVLIHELGHAISHEFGYGGGNLEFIKINFNIFGMIPREDKWFPSDYAKTQPEECFAESFACYMNKTCVKEMSEKNKELYEYMKGIFEPWSQ